jgi:hypothetical protein
LNKDDLNLYLKEVLSILDRFLKQKDDDMLSNLVIEKIVKMLMLKIDH